MKLLRNSVTYYITLGTNCANLQLTLKIVKIGDYKLHITFLSYYYRLRGKMFEQIFFSCRSVSSFQIEFFYDKDCYSKRM